MDAVVDHVLVAGLNSAVVSVYRRGFRHRVAGSNSSARGIASPDLPALPVTDDATVEQQRGLVSRCGRTSIPPVVVNVCATTRTGAVNRRRTTPHAMINRERIGMREGVAHDPSEYGRETPPIILTHGIRARARCATDDP